MPNMDLIKSGDVVIFKGNEAPIAGVVYDVKTGINFSGLSQFNKVLYTLRFQYIAGIFSYDNRGILIEESGSLIKSSCTDHNIIAFATPNMILEMLDHRMLQECEENYNKIESSEKIGIEEVENILGSDEEKTKNETKSTHDKCLIEFISLLSDHHFNLLMKIKCEDFNDEIILSQTHFHRGFLCALQVIRDKIEENK